MIMERDPEPTDPMVTAACRAPDCPCSALDRSADAWGGGRPRGGGAPGQRPRDRLRAVDDETASARPVVLQPRGVPVTTLLIVILVVLALGGGGWGYSRWGWGGGVGPIGGVLLILLILYLMGYLHG